MKNSLKRRCSMRRRCPDVAVLAWIWTLGEARELLVGGLGCDDAGRIGA
jgi:hypothetical protein